MNLETIKLEKFTGVMRKFKRDISITRSRSFGLPSVFWREEGLEGCTHAEVWYDSCAKVIAIKFLRERSDACYKLSVYGSGKSRAAHFSAQLFFRRYGLDALRLKGRYGPTKARIEGIGDVYLIQLDKSNL